jgi:hypothetical protein
MQPPVGKNATLDHHCPKEHSQVGTTAYHATETFFFSFSFLPSLFAHPT